MRPCKAVSNLGRNGEETGFSALRFPAFSDPFDEGVVGACSDDLGELGKANRGQPLRRDRWQPAVRTFLDENVVEVLWPSGEKLSQHIVILPLSAQSTRVRSLRPRRWKEVSRCAWSAPPTASSFCMPLGRRVYDEQQCSSSTLGILRD